MYRRAINHLRKSDPRLAAVIEQVGPCTLAARTDGDGHFGHIARAIVYQQLSGRAAGTIHSRFEALYGGRSPTPEEVLATTDEALRGVGLSQQKVAYIRDLARHTAAGTVPLATIDELSDEDVIEALITVKGIGRWTAQMFLIFRLGRLDILPELDLGVQKGLQRAYGLRKLPAPKDVLRHGAKWRPFASVAAWYLWRLLDEDVVLKTQPGAKASGRAAPVRVGGTARPGSSKSAGRPALKAAKKRAARSESRNAGRPGSQASKRTPTKRPKKSTGRRIRKPEG